MILVVGVLGIASAASAQNLNSGYFNDGYLYRHGSNPAFGNDQNYVAMPGVGNLNVSVLGNLRVDDVIHNVNGRTVLFTHPGVSTSSFLDGVNNKNKINESLKLQILGAGFKGWGGYNTIEINARQDLSINVPGSLLRMAKQGLENKTYDIKDFDAHADAYAEIALGHSRQVTEDIRVGGKLKVLLGIGNVDAHFNKAQLSLGEDEWVGVTNAVVHTSLNDMKYKTETKARGPEADAENGLPADQRDHTYVSGIDDTNFGVSGFGFAFDLGAEWKINKNWSVSGAILDLGFISWSKDFVASTNGDREVHTNDHLFSFDDKADNGFDREMDRFTEDVAALYELQDNGDMGGRTRALGSTLNLGVEYTPDFYDKLSFGLLNSTRIAGKYSWTEFRLSANVSPAKMFSASANIGVGTFGASFGWLLNFHPSGFNLFLATDYMPGKLAKQGVPLNSKANINLGINFPFGH